MGITISSKRYRLDMGYGGFKRFRTIVSALVGEKFYTHYVSMDTPEISFLSGEKREEYFNNYNIKIQELIEKKEVTHEVAHFLYESDCEGKINRQQSKQIYELIKNEDDNICFGYIGRKDCAKMADMKNIFNDNTKIEWS